MWRARYEGGVAWVLGIIPAFRFGVAPMHSGVCSFVGTLRVVFSPKHQ
jgi:hypothetical protein